MNEMFEGVKSVEITLDMEQRREAWSGTFAPSGYDYYYGPERERKSFVADLPNREFWEARNFKPSNAIQSWIDGNYPGFQQDMRDLAAFAWLRRSDYLAVCDYIATLWNDRKMELSTILGFTNLANYMSERLGIVFDKGVAFRLSGARYSGDWLDCDRAILEEFLCGAEYDDFWESALIAPLDELLSDMVRAFRPNDGWRNNGESNVDSAEGYENMPPRTEDPQP